VVLFGSRATGEYTQQSDWDVVVVSPLFAHEEAMFRRAQMLLAALEPVRGIDPVGLAPDELAALDCLLVLDAVADGVPLYDDGCFDRARTRLAEYLTRGERERLGGGWRISDT
jgi:predicted nucleotidyltransferase